MNNRKGFTLVEVIAVVVILGVILMIAVPSITGLSNRSKKKQITEDAKMFEELVKAKIESDTTIEISGTATAKFTLKSIEGKLSADYDEDYSYVEVSGCGYNNNNNNKYSCSTYKTYLYPKSGDYGYEENSYTQNPKNKTRHGCMENSWCKYE